MTLRTIGRAFGRALGLAALFWVAPAGALQIANGDFVGIWIKDGTEVIVNMHQVSPGSMLDLSTQLTPLGNMAGAKFVGLAVEDPAMMVNVPGNGSQPQQNVIYTSQAVDPMPTDLEIEEAMNILDSTLPSGTWFWQLRSLAGDASTTTLDVTDTNSYTNILGLGTDAIANRFTFSTAGTYDGDGKLSIGVYSAVRGYVDFGGPATEYTALGNLELDGANVDFTVPEASDALSLASGALVLLGAARFRRRTRA